MSSPLPVPNVVATPPTLPAGTTQIKLHPGPQTMFWNATADIVVYGGAAGGGKTWALLMDALKYAALQPVEGYDAVIFRRSTPEITRPGALWDKSHEIYRHIPGAVAVRSPAHRWTWDKWNTSITFYHLVHEDTVYEYQGAEISYIGFDELTHFTEQQFWYMLSRNRSTIGVRSRIRATTNPDADSWVKPFLAPWVDEKYEYPAESGEVRWFYRDDGTLHWLPPNTPPPAHISLTQLKSCTFIAATLFDNPTLMEKDPGYLANLQAMPLIERRRLLDADWSIRPSGNMFRRQWFQVIEPDEVPKQLDATYRAWDNAGTEEPTKVNEQASDPDYTASVKLGFSSAESRFYVMDVINQRLSPKGVTDLMYKVMSQDGIEVTQYEEQEGGWSGKGMADIHRARFAAFDYHVVRPMTNKIVRAKPFSSAVEGGIVYLVRAPWNEEYINQLCAFPKHGVHDDMVDASAMAYNQLAKAVGLENYMADRLANTGEALSDEPPPPENVSGGAFGFGNLFGAVRQAQEQRAAQVSGQPATEQELDPFGYPLRPDDPSAPQTTQAADTSAISLANILQMLQRLQ